MAFTIIPESDIEREALDITTGRRCFPKGRIRLPAKRLSMRKIKEVLRLKYELGLGQRQIARSYAIGLGTVNDYLVRAERAGIRWPLPKGWEEPEVEAALFGSGPARSVNPSVPRRTLRPSISSARRSVS